MDARPQDRTSQNNSGDDEHSNTFINQQTAIVKASARNTPLTPPRKKIVFGLPTPSPDPHPRPYFYLTSPTPPSRNILDDTNKFLTSAGEPSEESSEECIGSTLSISAGIPTPDSTPTRRSICKEKAFIKSESSYSLETSTRSVVESTEASLPAAEILRNKLSGISEPEDDTRTTRPLDDQEANLPTISSAKVKCPRRRRSKATIKCGGTKCDGAPCRRMVKPPAQRCHDHPVTNNTSVTPVTSPVPTVVLTTPTGTIQYCSATDPVTEVDTHCRGTTRRRDRCKRTVIPPAQYCHDHIPAIHGIPIMQTAPTAATGTLQYIATVPIYISINLTPVQYYPQHISPIHFIPITPITPTTPTRVSVRCSGHRCRQRISIYPGQPRVGVYYCDEHSPKSDTPNNNNPTQHCSDHIPATKNIDTSRPPLASPFITSQSRPDTDPLLPPDPIAHPSISVGVRSRPLLDITPNRSRAASATPSPSPSANKNTTRRSSMTNSKAEKQCSRKHSDKIMAQTEFYPRQTGKEDRLVKFSDYIPPYLQRDTQVALRVEMEKATSSADTPGYVYAFEIQDSERPDVIQLKVGRTVNLVKRLDQWDKQCGSKEQIPRGWWPCTLEDDSDDDGTNGSLLKGCIKAGEPGPLCHRVERLVHIELLDLVEHMPYLKPHFPKIDNSDLSSSGVGSPAPKKAAKKPCLDCGETHQEIFAFLRPEKGPYKGREWELLVKPVIEKWGKFVSDYYA